MARYCRDTITIHGKNYGQGDEIQVNWCSGIVYKGILKEIKNDYIFLTDACLFNSGHWNHIADVAFYMNTYGQHWTIITNGKYIAKDSIPENILDDSPILLKTN